MKKNKVHVESRAGKIKMLESGTQMEDRFAATNQIQVPCQARADVS
jgi:hypothetical protein